MEQQALATLDPGKATQGMTAVSAVSRWYKAGRYERVGVRAGEARDRSQREADRSVAMLGSSDYDKI
jgi:hypothetical protein